MASNNKTQDRWSGTRLGTSTIRCLAWAAIRDRLGPEYVAEYGTDGCIRHVHALEDGTVAVHLNSGGNAEAVASALERERFVVWRGTRPDYGVLLIVSASGVGRRNGGDR